MLSALNAVTSSRRRFSFVLFSTHASAPRIRVVFNSTQTSSCYSQLSCGIVSARVPVVFNSAATLLHVVFRSAATLLQLFNSATTLPRGGFQLSRRTSSVVQLSSSAAALHRTCFGFAIVFCFSLFELDKQFRPQIRADLPT